MQRYVWAVFDWCALNLEDHAAERGELQVRLAEVLRRLALTPQQIESLPDNYVQAVTSREFATEYDPAHTDRAFLPPDLFDQHRPWVAILGRYLEPVATSHVFSFSGRSRFLVFVRLPGGRKATLDYLQTLWNFPQPWVARRDMAPDQTQVNPDLPQFPVRTQVALVRQMTYSTVGASSCQRQSPRACKIRVYRAITAREDRNNVAVDWPAAGKEQDFYEVRLSQARLFAGQAGGLKAVARDETEFSVFQTQGQDVFEFSAKRHVPKELGAPILDRCVTCHSAPGINSLDSRSKLLKPNYLQRDSESAYPTRWWENDGTIYWKQERYDWGLLNGFWKASERFH